MRKHKSFYDNLGYTEKSFKIKEINSYNTYTSLTGTATEAPTEEYSRPFAIQAKDMRLRGTGEDGRLEGMMNPTYLQVRSWFIQTD